MGRVVNSLPQRAQRTIGTCVAPIGRPTVIYHSPQFVAAQAVRGFDGGHTNPAVCHGNFQEHCSPAADLPLCDSGHCAT